MSEIIRLPNGLRLAHHYIPHLHTVSFGVFIKIGSRNELASDNGIAHFTEHMMFKGTEKRSAFDLVKEMDALGANMNAFTSKEMTAYYFQCMDDTVEECAEILSDALLHSTFPEEEIERERGVILEEINMVYDIPDDLSQELCCSAFWGDYPLGRAILGPQENVKRFTSQDIRDFISRYYVSQNISISIAGNITAEASVELVQKYFHFPSGQAVKRTFDVPLTYGGRVEACYKDIEQANLTIAVPAIASLDDRIPALAAFSFAFGGGMSSMLFQEVREKLGLVYSIYTYHSVYEDRGAFCLYLGTNPKNLKKALDAVNKCVRDFTQRKIDQETFHRAKQQVKCGLVMGGESCMSLMRAGGKNVLFRDEPYSLERCIADVENTTLESVNDLIPQILGSKEIGVGYVGVKPEFDLAEIYR